MPSNVPEGGAPVAVGFGLGSNIGDKPANIRRALALIEARDIAEITAVSSIYRTAPWGNLDQEAFANACALAQTRLPPTALLAAIKAIEAEMGRTVSVHWGPRLIDIDILFYGEVALATEELTLPHKDLFDRGFVLVPLAEVAPDMTLLGRSVAEAATHLRPDGIERWPDAPHPSNLA